MREGSDPGSCRDPRLPILQMGRLLAGQGPAERIDDSLQVRVAERMAEGQAHGPIGDVRGDGQRRGVYPVPIAVIRLQVNRTVVDPGTDSIQLERIEQVVATDWRVISDPYLVQVARVTCTR